MMENEALVDGPVMSLWRGTISPPARRISMTEMASMVADSYGITVDDLKGQSRVRRVAWPRQHAMWLMAQEAHLSLPMIGAFLGGRDHTTVLHGRNRHQARIEAGTVGVSL